MHQIAHFFNRLGVEQNLVGQEVRPRRAVLPVEDVVEVVQRQGRDIEQLGDLTLEFDGGIQRCIGVGEHCVDFVAILLQEIAQLGQHHIELLSGGAATQILVGKHLAENPDGGPEVAQHRIVGGCGVHQRAQIVDHRGELFLALGTAIGAELEGLGQFAERGLDAIAVTGRHQGSRIDEGADRAVTLAVAAERAGEPVDHV